MHVYLSAVFPVWVRSTSQERQNYFNEQRETDYGDNWRDIYNHVFDEEIPDFIAESVTMSTNRSQSV